MADYIVGITGGSGAIYALSLLKALQELKINTHVIISKAAEKVLLQECDVYVNEIEELSTVIYESDDFMAPIASGSYKIDGMVIVPCSMKTLSAVANGYSDSLITRSADVVIKEHRKLVLVTRETPLSAIHLENMLKLSRLGVTIFPPAPGFYNNPKTIEDIIINMTGRILDEMGINNKLVCRWGDVL